MNRTKFENIYPNLDDKIIFLFNFDLINLQKAGKIGKISLKKMDNKKQAIDSILSFDVKHKFLICNTIYANQNEYLKSKANNNKNFFKTSEINNYQIDNTAIENKNVFKDKLADKFKTSKNNNFIVKKNKITELKTKDNIKTHNNINTFNLDTDTNIKFNTDDIKVVSLNANKKSTTKIIQPILKTNTNNIYKEALEQSHKVRNLIKKFNERKEEIKKEKNKALIEYQYKQKLKELEKERQFQKQLLYAQRRLQSKQISKISNTIKLINNHSICNKNYQCKNQKNSFLNYFSSPNNENSKVKAKYEIDKLNYIDIFESYKDVNNKKILIIKGR